MDKELYLSREDSFFLQGFVKKHSFGDVLDVGTGTGIQAETASQLKNVRKVLAVDINNKAIQYCKKRCKTKKIKFAVSDLFKEVKGKFDTIIFNPPYLSQEGRKRDVKTEGGRKGYETAVKFLNKAKKHLKKSGIILLLFSSFTNKQKIDEVIEKNLFVCEELGRMNLFFETLYVYKISFNKILAELSNKLSNIKYFAKGKRGVVYTAVCKNKKVAVKMERKESGAVCRIKNEANFLKLLNKHCIGPKLLFAEDSFIVYEFAGGVPIKEFLLKSKKENICKVLKAVFGQCLAMDKLRINKEEMHRPAKHIIIGRKVVMIDFERCHFVKEPKNVAQFLQFIINNTDLFNQRGFNWEKKDLIKSAVAYHENKKIEKVIDYLGIA